MKVGTDGVLLGAWAGIENVNEILDIGTGTGLIALMAAQRSNAMIDAIEIDKDATLQAAENIGKSPWKHRISVQCISLQSYARKCMKKYDHIVCNPPYFSNSVKAKGIERSIARHTIYLSNGELLQAAAVLLGTGGTFSLIYPFSNFDDFNKSARAEDLYLSRFTLVKPTCNKKPNRILAEFRKERSNSVPTGQLILYDEKEKTYTPEFQFYIRDFYLNY
jgi:tRNA1Val (adenine37-N6)-methyltransferase